MQPGGIILTTFDRRNMWAVDLDRKTRYPLEGVRPCGTNCHLSPDFRWITYLNPLDATFYKMQLDGSERTPLAENATDVLWWTDDILLIWSPEHHPSLLNPDGRLTDLDLHGGISIQPGGQWALALRYISTDADFRRILINLDQPDDVRVLPGADRQYFGATAWSPDGTWLAYVTPIEHGESTDPIGGEIYGINLVSGLPAQWTHLNTDQNRVRIGGQTPASGLSPSPDGTKLAFWVTPATDLPIDSIATPEVQPEIASSIIHVLDIPTRTIQRYCDYSTQSNIPAPPRLVWSPDSSHLVFADNPPDDPRGALLIGLNLADGVYIELSEGIYPALGSASVVAWGLPPS
jgi:hypothetical protein